MKDGRGHSPAGDELMVSMLIRLSVNEDTNSGHESQLIKHGLIADPVYGSQVQNRAIQDVLAEASVELEWNESVFKFPDSRSVQLRNSEVIISDLGYGDYTKNQFFLRELHR